MQVKKQQLEPYMEQLTGSKLGKEYDKAVSCHPAYLTDMQSAAKSLQSCPTLCDPIDGSPPGSPSLGFSRQEQWSGLPFPSPLAPPKGSLAKDNSVQFSSVAQSCPTLCDPMDCSTPGLPVHHQLPELAQTHIHGVGDVIQPCHPRSSPSPPTLNLSLHQGLFQ